MVRYVQEFKHWRQKRKDISLPAYINPLLESCYQLYSSDEEIMCKLHEGESTDLVLPEQPEAAEAEGGVRPVE